MKEEQFLKTMIEAIKYDKKYNNKSELLGILRYSVLTYERTGTYGRKQDHFREYVCLRVPIPMLEMARFLEDDFERVASEVYMKPTDTMIDYEYAGIQIKPKPVDLEEDLHKEHDVVFDEIKEVIIQGIRGAKYTIWIAVAWFTDRDIFKELLLRKQVGVNIRIITSAEDSNKYLLPDLERNFEVMKVKLWGKNLSNRVHDKFCIIDFEYVMHGTYNWSNNAINNNETWATALDRDFVRKFADEFTRLLVEHQQN
ncbi:phospholipase D-like domain-containing protein [Cohnella sp. AR92]|uniref:phospholipase D-like domain-containing protein n=1 Tax=Cohnella sp. AR92 TaxID=648716 RepID=UPI000F8C5F95|nr:phospholipase D-like domain-containing protein [Cohnella sp. AR92]RUS44611.1 DUF1669 domain-containing protein [Cohnella sp. AR92]